MEIGNLFAQVPQALPEELFQRLPTASEAIRIERIVSRGHATAPGQWYDQADHEWVLLLRGSAGLRFEGEEAVHILMPGDYLDIPAGRRHRVEWTHPLEDTLWLAVHYPAAEAGPSA